MSEGASSGNYKLLFSMIIFMLVLTLLSIVSGNSFIPNSAGDSYSAIVNGTTSDYTISSEGFSIDEYTGAIGWLVVIVAIGVIASISILGSGLGSVGANLLYKSIFYGSIWGIVSIFPAPLIFTILYFGPVFYITLTIVYVIIVIMVI